jgi:hypothetical protein
VLLSDIEGAFNNTLLKILVQVMHQYQMVQYLTLPQIVCCDGLREIPKPFKAGLPQGFPALPFLFLIYVNTIMNLTIPMNDDSESECSYIDGISIVQGVTNTDNAIFCLKTLSEIQIDRAKILHIQY